MRNWKQSIWLFLATFSFAARPTYAACDPTLANVKLSDCYLLNPNDGTTVATTFEKPTDLINLVVRNLFVVAGIMIFVTLLYAGYQFQTGGAKAKDQALQTIKTAAIGFIIMFAAFWIVQIVRVITGTNINL